jgi:hypothetical protein
MSWAKMNKFKENLNININQKLIILYQLILTSFFKLSTGRNLERFKY